MSGRASLSVAILLIALALQFLVHWRMPPAQARATDLPPLPSVAVLRAASLDEPIALSKALMLYLQAFDNQPGLSIPFRDLDGVVTFPLADLLEWSRLPKPKLKKGGQKKKKFEKIRHAVLDECAVQGEAEFAPAKCELGQ